MNKQLSVRASHKPLNNCYLPNARSHAATNPKELTFHITFSKYIIVHALII
jgi:hypothetical protein